MIKLNRALGAGHEELKVKGWKVEGLKNITFNLQPKSNLQSLFQNAPLSSGFFPSLFEAGSFYFGFTADLASLGSAYLSTS